MAACAARTVPRAAGGASATDRTKERKRRALGRTQVSAPGRKSLAPVGSLPGPPGPTTAGTYGPSTDSSIRITPTFLTIACAEGYRTLTGRIAGSVAVRLALR